ncbi:hypothetical protein RCM87_07615 [Escherichia marmotae]|jgi:hypothetical protein|uniref:Uncharacterized protein n=1 Tax=Escherichia marmotae TaxID=1499973 RepID=A0A7L6LBS1_9ESCH|nr:MULTISPECIES: hypothetical protein [Escherichia]EFG1980913.1 hypothetical protein [Escherichia coli]MBB2334189.1 hypothetical protein [Escherichia sp. 93.0724]MBA7896666.1 hypothetical protein [Escherichia marmotae]MCE5354085.1 hypothetical protein [Escherichia marmotae]MDQ9226235.1 hypothetical protein [Escherichia marmotae]
MNKAHFICNLAPVSGRYLLLMRLISHAILSLPSGSFFILIKDKKRPLLKLQGPGTSKHHIGRHDATVKIIWPDGVQ